MPPVPPRLSIAAEDIPKALALLSSIRHELQLTGSELLVFQTKEEMWAAAEALSAAGIKYQVAVKIPGDEQQIQG